MPTLEDHRIAVRLQKLFGHDVGTRRSSGDVAGAVFQRSVFVNRQAARDEAFDLMWDYESRGLVENSPGPRGGAGWTLSEKGAALIASLMKP